MARLDAPLRVHQGRGRVQIYPRLVISISQWNFPRLLSFHSRNFSFVHSKNLESRIYRNFFFLAKEDKFYTEHIREKFELNFHEKLASQHKRSWIDRSNDSRFFFFWYYLLASMVHRSMRHTFSSLLNTWSTENRFNGVLHHFEFFTGRLLPSMIDGFDDEISRSAARLYMGSAISSRALFPFLFSFLFLSCSLDEP